ncbi:MAG: hypothetical protein KGY99_04935 [Phycisphaerae bacterium]|nr:hypothetical protein [Phycisphaerae bacterium]
MARRNNNPQPAEEGGGTAGDWIVTFSDCMTLLLCFFVLLLTFSSFEEIEAKRLAGAFDYMTLHSVFPIKREIPSSIVPPIPRQQDQVREGAETPQDADWDRIEIPEKLPEILALDAYKDRRVLSFRSSDMFWARGVTLTPEAENCLRMIATFVRQVPCRVVIRETSPQIGLGRAAAVARYLADDAKLPTEYCYVSVPAPGHQAGSDATGELEIALLSWETY